MATVEARKAVSTFTIEGSERTFQRAAALAAILSAPLAAGSMYFGLKSVDFNYEVFDHIELVLQAGPAGAGLVRTGMILDLLGYYLLIVPLTLVLWRWLRRPAPSASALFALCLIAYSLIGSIGAALLAAVAPPLMHAYAAPNALREAIELVFARIRTQCTSVCGTCSRS